MNMIFLIVLLVTFYVIKGIVGKNKKSNNVINSTNMNSTIGDNIEIEKEYLKREDEIIEDIIKSELQKNKYDGKNIVEVEKKRFKVTIIFSILNFIFISLIFFHLPIYWYLLEIVNIVFFVVFTRRYDTIEYLKRELKARPDDDISNIISSILASGTANKGKTITKAITVILVSFVLPLIIFIKPMTFYEKNEDGYYVRFYTTGLIRSKEITISEKYKGENVVGIRGNVFANIKFVKKINLPDSINVIRGKAFENDVALEEINLPENLTYLGGGTFKGCTSLESITIPKGVTVINGNTFEDCKSLKKINLHDGITEIHGETFINCKSLVNIELPSKITEIRGNTFENCESLESINIPNGVTRIGGHAFYGCISLKNVSIPATLKEIGSSAFRRCYSLESIKIPYGTSVKENSFKESPTKVTKYSSNENTDADDNKNEKTNTITNSVTNSTTNKNTNNTNSITFLKKPKVIPNITNTNSTTHAVNVTNTN